ncbi:MAG TPA: LPS export ABC transporter permease LptG, partial [Xanthobacteraceae bacterium]|nr:LPS export ABC transporter permease LptG [Xanthobacteraceae bacterium]
MVAFGKLGRYFGRRFLGAVVLVFINCAVLIGIVDFFEFSRRLGERADISVLDIGYLVLLRLPAYSEQMFPFAILIGAMASFLTLSRRLELVIARTVGASVWQFTLSTVAIALLLGVFLTAVYNPVSASLKERANKIEAALFNDRGSGLFQQSTDGIWVRQQSVDGQAILQAQASSDKGRAITGVRIFSFDQSGNFVERIEAKSATLGDGVWKLKEARVFPAGAEWQDYDSYLVSTNLTPEQVQGSLGSADSLSFWDLPSAIAASKRAGIRAERYQLQYQLLLARPLLFVTMVLIAASVSLRIFRLGGVGKMMLSGVLAGFLLYVAQKLAGELGENGILHPVV